MRIREESKLLVQAFPRILFSFGNENSTIFVLNPGHAFYSDTMPTTEPHPLNMKDEQHRAFVRDVNTKLSSVYGYGGGVILLSGAMVLGAAWYLHALTYIASWILTFTLMLIGLFVLRTVVKREKIRARQRVEAYCDANGMTHDDLRREFDSETFVYFFDLFKES